MECPRVAVFDLDDTLAESFKSPSVETLDALKRLLSAIPVAIMTGAGFARMEAQFLPELAACPDSGRFYLFPNSSAQCYARRNDAWKLLYSFTLTPDERARIKETILKAVDENPVLSDVPHWGERMFDREAQVAYTPVGINATLETKRTWDPGGVKRALLFEALKRTLPEFEILLGGTTTIDITPKDINKAYGVKWLSDYLKMPTSGMLYVGDAFHEGGNDTVVIPTGIRTRRVSGPEETLGLIKELLAVCK